MIELHDPVTKTAITEAQQAEAERVWAEAARAVGAEVRPGTVTEICSQLYRWLDQQSGAVYRRSNPGNQRATELELGVPLCRHAPESFVPDHALLSSAIAYCLAYGREDVHWIRLVALSHEFPSEARRNLVGKAGNVPDWVMRAWDNLEQLEAALNANRRLEDWSEGPPGDDGPSDMLWRAHLAASRRLDVVGAAAEFATHPLFNAQGKIGLVVGGASKIKSYVFESSKLPEIRGASALLDRINLLDTPALWGRELEWSGDETVRQTQEDRFERIRGWPEVLEAPECVIYANGGDVLALAPTAKAEALASRLEWLYAEETLTAGGVFAAGVYSLLELQYGLHCIETWLAEFEAAWADADQRKLLESYYGKVNGDATPRTHFLGRKNFGELVTHLALKRERRCEGNPDAEHWASRRPIPLFETLPHDKRCSSCDRRGAVIHIPELDDYLCEPCSRKRWVGWKTKKVEQVEARLFGDRLRWRPEGVEAWYRPFEGWLKTHPAMGDRYYGQLGPAERAQVDNPGDLKQIGTASSPKRFIGVIYGDGNNVGALIEKINTPGEYRQFARRLYEATKDAVFRALAYHLHPQPSENGGLIHPFEILSIGGDDLFVIVPGHRALEVAEAIARELERAFRQTGAENQPPELQRYRPDKWAEPPAQISLSAGVVIAAEDNPIFFLNDIVEDLLMSAKGYAKKLKERTEQEVDSGRLHVPFTGGAVDFAVLKAVTMVTSSMKDYRAEALEVQRGDDRLYITGRPYTLHELGGLRATVRALKQAGFPRSQLYHLCSRLFKSRKASTVDYLYFRSRLSDKDQAVVTREFEEAWHDHRLELAPWRHREPSPKLWEPARKDGHFYAETVFADLLEIYDFVSREEENAQSDS